MIQGNYARTHHITAKSSQSGKELRGTDPAPFASQQFVVSLHVGEPSVGARVLTSITYIAEAGSYALGLCTSGAGSRSYRPRNRGLRGADRRGNRAVAASVSECEVKTKCLVKFSHQILRDLSNRVSQSLY